VVLGLSNEAYHAGPGLARSTLWTMYAKTPAHTRLIAEKESTAAMDVGSALDVAVLDPANFELRVMRGPADRRGNKWTDAVAEAANTKRIVLPEQDYANVELMREIALAHPTIGPIVSRQDGVRGASAYVKDKHGTLLKARPDLWVPKVGLMVDLKTSRDASLRGFSRSIADYGYHVQEQWYRSVWTAAGGGEVQAFLFFVVETTDPFQIAVYEIAERAREKADDIIRQTMQVYRACVETGFWPGYPDEVVEIDLPSWAYRNDGEVE
jgi:exodeoxyribonuclease VIII